MTIRDFIKHIKILIKAKGYKDFQNRNIQLDIILLGKTMNYINNNFRVKINDIIETLTLKGINFLKPKDFDFVTLVGLEWTFLW